MLSVEFLQYLYYYEPLPVPGSIDKKEVRSIARDIAEVNHDIPQPARLLSALPDVRSAALLTDTRKGILLSSRARPG